MRTVVMDHSKLRNILGKVLLICLLGILLVFCIVGIWKFKYHVVLHDERATSESPSAADDVDQIVPLLGNHLPEFFGFDTSMAEDDEPSYRILLNGQLGSPSGKVYILTEEALSFLCNDGFTDADAAVVCREVGFSKAAVYNFLAPHPYMRYTTYRPVLKQLNCTGNETTIRECEGFRLHNVTSCEWFATVVCYDDQPYQLRLVNGVNPDSGLVEIKIGDEWGTFCAIRQFNDDVADILCRNMNYTGGVTLLRGELGEVNLPTVWVPYISCLDGARVKHSILECSMILHTDNIPRDLIDYRNNRYNNEYMACNDKHSYAAAIQCFKHDFQGI